MSQGHDLSHIRYTAGHTHHEDQVTIMVSKWNDEITEALKMGALSVLKEAGIPEEQIQVHYVPGSYELTSGADFALTHQPILDGIICLGCVIQGETRHFDFICQAVAQGITNVSIKHHKPVIFGVLTPDNQQQALDRAGGKYGNKGEEAAVALLEMIDLRRAIV
ncbi:MAG: 6,7-dimethyl-8-ribityllumazine synthase [Bacteroidota bacterium]